MSENKIFTAVNMMMQTEKMHRCLLESKVKDFGMHITSHRVLMHLARFDKLLSQKELADRLSITPAAVTGILKRLEAEKYIERRPSSDNRYNEISITDKGRDVVEHTRQTFGSADRALFEDFSDEELEVYVRCLEKMQNNIKKQLSQERKKQ
jgi:DNA-binding MarR family transcriptional regulator